MTLVSLVCPTLFHAHLSTHLCLQTHTHLCTLFITVDCRLRKKMFAMQGNPYLNTPLHKAKGIKKLILIPAVFDVLDGELPRDFIAGWITLSLAMDRLYPLWGFRSGPGVSICVCICTCYLIPTGLHASYRKAPKVEISPSMAMGYFSRIIIITHLGSRGRSNTIGTKAGKRWLTLILSHHQIIYDSNKTLTTTAHTLPQPSLSFSVWFV